MDLGLILSILELFWPIFNIFLYFVLAVFTFFSIINLITAFFSLKAQKVYEPITPRVSVIVRAWNDGSVVERCIQSYLNQEYPKKEFEIIIADDGSQDKTKEICEYYAKRKCITYVHFPEHKNYKADVIDYVVKNVATGDIILETDVDGVPPPNWIKEMVRPFSDPSVGGVTGTVMCGNSFQGSISKVRTIEDFWHFCIALYGEYVMSGHGMLYGGSKGYTKEAWLKVGGHPKKTLVEDGEFALKLIEAGYKIVIIKSAPLIQEEVTTFEQYMSEQKRWVKGGLDLDRLYGPAMKKNKLGYLLMLSNFSWEAAYFFSFIFLPYQLLLAIPIIINLSALYIGMFGLKAKGIFFLFALPYVWVGPLLRAIVILSLLKNRILRRPVTWTKVWHYPTQLKYPTFS